MDERQSKAIIEARKWRDRVELLRQLDLKPEDTAPIVSLIQAKISEIEEETKTESEQTYSDLDELTSKAVEAASQETEPATEPSTDSSQGSEPRLDTSEFGDGGQPDVEMSTDPLDEAVERAQMSQQPMLPGFGDEFRVTASSDATNKPEEAKPSTTPAAATQEEPKELPKPQQAQPETSEDTDESKESQPQSATDQLAALIGQAGVSPSINDEDPQKLSSVEKVMPQAALDADLGTPDLGAGPGQDEPKVEPPKTKTQSKLDSRRDALLNLQKIAVDKQRERMGLPPLNAGQGDGPTQDPAQAYKQTMASRRPADDSRHHFGGAMPGSYPGTNQVSADQTNEVYAISSDDAQQSLGFLLERLAAGQVELARSVARAHRILDEGHT